MRTLSAFLSLTLALLVGTDFNAAAQGTPGNQQGHLALLQLSPSPGVVGATITISGQNLGTTQGSSTITFNGMPAPVLLWNNWTILATVPAGKTSGMWS
jgi:hypothetical protein